MTGIPDAASDRLPYHHAISLAVALDPHAVAQLGNGPTLDYYNERNKVMALMSMMEEATADFLRKRGYQAATFSHMLHQLQERGVTLSDAPALDHRMIAAHAGLGWIGKNGLIITKHYGPAIHLGSLFTDAPLSCCKEVFLSRCGRCIDCVSICPADAIGNTKDDSVIANISRVNKQACMSACIDQSRRNFGIEAGVCGLCIYACPYTESFLYRSGALSL